jgi:hypothetical protein
MKKGSIHSAKDDSSATGLMVKPEEEAKSAFSNCKSMAIPSEPSEEIKP